MKQKKERYVLIGVENREICSWFFDSFKEAKKAMFADMLNTGYVTRSDLYDKHGNMKKQSPGFPGMSKAGYGSDFKFNDTSAEVIGTFADFDYLISGPSDKNCVLAEIEDGDICVTWHDTLEEAKEEMLKAMEATRYVNHGDLFNEDGSAKKENPERHNRDRGEYGSEYSFNDMCASIDTNNENYDWDISEAEFSSVTVKELKEAFNGECGVINEAAAGLSDNTILKIGDIVIRAAEYPEKPGCILITVCDRDITAERFISVEAAREAMHHAMIETGYCCPADFCDKSGAPLKEGGDEDDTFGFSESGGYVNGRYETDWQIIAI